MTSTVGSFISSHFTPPVFLQLKKRLLLVFSHSQWGQLCATVSACLWKTEANLPLGLILMLLYALWKLSLFTARLGLRGTLTKPVLFIHSVIIQQYLLRLFINPQSILAVVKLVVPAFLQWVIPFYRLQHPLEKRSMCFFLREPQWSLFTYNSNVITHIFQKALQYSWTNPQIKWKSKFILYK